jgi:putative NADH-flavin reductase
MPLIVVGADTPAGNAILEEVSPREREIRVFVTDEDRGLELKDLGFKVATGDVSDDSHIEAASTRCFSAVLIAEAATDERERSFAKTREEVLAGWARAISSSAVTRAIWVLDDDPPDTDVAEVVAVKPTDPNLARSVIDLDEAASIS